MKPYLRLDQVNKKQTTLVGNKKITKPMDKSPQTGGSSSKKIDKSSTSSEISTNESFSSMIEIMPLTPEKCPGSVTQRVHFKRRKSHVGKQILILHFEGVVGTIEILQKAKNQDLETKYDITLRYEAIEGLLELKQNFQLVLFTGYGRQLSLILHDYFVAKNIHFDAVYSLESTDKFYVNYNQIYADFHVIEYDDQTMSPSEKIEREILIISSLALESTEIEKHDMLTHLTSFDCDCISQPLDPLQLNPSEKLNFWGLPVESQEYVPLILLVPHMRSQRMLKCVSFIQILNLVNKLQVVSYFKRRETVMDFQRLYSRDRIKQESLLNPQTLSDSMSPKRPREVSPEKLQKFQSPETQVEQNEFKGFQMMVTTIQPTNIYKKLLATCCDKNLNRESCNFMNSFYTVDKHKLFDCNTTMSIKLIAQVEISKRNELISQMSHQISYLSNYLHSLKPRPALEAMNEAQQKLYDTLIQQNSLQKEIISKYAKQQTMKANVIIQQYSSYMEFSQDQSDEQRCRKTLAFIQGQIEEIKNQECAKYPIYRFLVLKGDRFQNYAPVQRSILRNPEQDIVIFPFAKSKTFKDKSQRNIYYQIQERSNLKTSNEGTQGIGQNNPGFRIHDSGFNRNTRMGHNNKMIINK